MKATKKVLTFLLSLAILLTMMPAGVIVASAETTYSGQCGDNAFWELDATSGAMIIAGTGDMYDYSYNSGQIVPWKSYRYLIKSITISSGITKIGDNSFLSFSNIESVSIADTVEVIGAYAFHYCESITTINVPSSVRIIGYGAFWGCEKLSSIILNEGLQEIEADAFRSTKINSIYIPSTTKELNDYNDSYMDYFGRYWNVFEGCDNLTKIEVGEGNPTYVVKNGALYNKNSNVLLTAPKIRGEFSVSEGTEWIASASFENCSNITKISLPTGVKIIGQSAFDGCSSIQEMVIPEGVEIVGRYAFFECSSMEKISFPSTVTEIYTDELFFSDCYKLSSINVAKTNSYYSAKDDILFNKDKTILYVCSPKKSGVLTVPLSVKFISNYAFNGCAYLTEVNLSKAVESITYDDTSSGYHCFSNCTRYTVPRRSPISYLKAINVDSDNSFFSSVNGVLYNKNKSTLIAFPSGRAGSFTVPSTTNIIGESAFVFSNLTNLIVSRSVSTIQENAIVGFRKMQSIRFLNPSCEFEDSWSLTRTDSDNCEPTIYAPLNSTAHRFATENYYTFVDSSDSTQKYKNDALCLYYSFDKNKIELGDIVNVGADYIRGNSLGMQYSGTMRWELSNPEVLQIESYSTKAAVLYFKAVGLGSCDITLYLDGKKTISDTVTVKVSDKTLLEDNSEYVFNSSAFSTLETARNTCKAIIDGNNGFHRSLASFFKSVENGLGIGVITKEALAAAGLTTSMAEDAEDKAVEKIMMELIAGDDPVGSAVDKIEKAYKVMKTGYSTITVDEERVFHVLVNAFDYSYDQAEELYNQVDDYKSKTDMAFDVLDVTLSAMLISQFEMDTIKDMRDATSYGSALYLTLDRLYAKRADLVAYATNRFLNEQAIGMLNELIGKLGGSTYKVAELIGTWSKMIYDQVAGLDAEDYLVAQNNWGFAGYLYNYSLKGNKKPENFERYYKYYIAAVKAALKSAVDISQDYRLTNIADGLYEQIELTCHYEDYFDQVRDDLNNVCSVSKETLESGKVLACYGGGIASYSLYNTELTGDVEATNDNFYDNIDPEKIFSIPAYIDGSRIEGIADYGFTGKSDIQGFMLPQTIETIGEYAFANCSNAKFAYLNSGLTEIGEGAFADCAQLEVLNLPGNLQVIGEDAFSNCSSLGSVTFGENVTTVGAKAFEGCKDLKAVYFNNASTFIAQDAFANCEGLTVYGYEGSTAQTLANNCGFTFVAFEDAVAEMRIITPATQREIVAGEVVSTDGLTVEVLYMDGTKETISSGWSIVCDTTSVGVQQVYVCYKDNSISYPITVTPKVVKEITLSDHELSLFITDSYQLVAECEINHVLDDLAWSSDNEEIVTVDESGYVTALKVGSANITVSLKDGSVFDRCKITVKNDERLEATDGRAQSQIFSPTKSGYYTFYSTGSTANTMSILYNTSGEIITTDWGLNTGISTWLVDDEAYYVDIETEKGNVLTIGVSESVEAESIAITTDEFSGEIGTEHQLELRYNPNNAFREKVVWKSSNEDIVSVDQSGLIKLNKKGSAIITVTSESGMTDMVEVTVEGYPVITTEKNKIVALDQDNQYAYFRFIPDEDACYEFYSYDSDYDTFGCILDSDMNEIESDDDSGDDGNFKVKCQLEAGVTYILMAQFYDIDNQGSFNVCIKKEHIHKSDSGTVTKKATCTSTGKITYKCVLCEEIIKTESIAKVEHNYDSGEVTKAATCKATGVKTYTCKTCGATKTSKIAKLTTHKYSNDCDKSCNVCGATRTIEHSYKKCVTKASLTSNGKIYHQCTVCDYVASKSTTIYRPYSFVLSTTSYTYNGKVRTPSVTVKDSEGNVLKKDKDYSVTYSSGRKNAGKYKVTVTMMGNYSGTKTLTFKIKPIDVSKCNLSLSTTSYTYNGKVKTPSVTVKNSNGTKLSKDTHYTVTYASGRKNSGSYKVTVTMMGNYSGTQTLTFKIKPIDISKCNLSLSTTSYTYNGKVKTPSVTVKNSNGTKLSKDTHYTVTYASGCKSVGTYKVTVKGKGNYSGTKTLTFKINPAKTSVSKLTAGKNSITVEITKKSTQVTGYQIQYSTSNTFSNATTKTISSYNTTKYTLKSLSAKKTYYVRVRTYKTVGETKYYSGWSTYKYVKTK